MSLLKRALDTAGSRIASLGTPPDLGPFAAQRGLAHSTSISMSGVFTGFDDPDKTFNVMYGELPGGELGVVGHVKQVTGYTQHDIGAIRQTTRPTPAWPSGSRRLWAWRPGSRSRTVSTPTSAPTSTGSTRRCS